MKNADELFSDIEKFRTPFEMKEYFEYIYNAVHSDDDYWNLALVKTGLFKKFLEEYYPLYCFSQSRFCNQNTKLTIVLGNQGFDSIIIDTNNTEHRLEITSYIDGKKDFIDGKMLQERGYSDVKFSDHLSLDERSYNYLGRILQNLKNKSLKDYSGIDLLFVVSTFSYYEVYNLSSSKFVNNLIQEIKNINFKCNDIFLLILNGNEKSNINQNIYKIK